MFNQGASFTQNVIQVTHKCQGLVNSYLVRDLCSPT